MEVKEKILELEKKNEFKNWKKHNKDCFLSYVMRLIENPPNNDWQIGFYDKKKEKITTFVMNKAGMRILKF